MGRKLMLTLAVLSLAFGFAAAATNKVVCYQGTWAAYRSGDGAFSSSDIDPSLCTHVIYSFVGLDSSTGSVVLLDEWLDINLSGFSKAIALKSTNANLKVLLAVGGWNEGSINYSNMANSATLRATFISSALALVQKYGFDGFDLDWEYPAQRGGGSYDKENFVTLLKEFREVFDTHGLLLTAAVAASPTSVDLSYDVPSLSKYLDIINLMEYDFFGAWDSNTGHNAPLYTASKYVGTTYAGYSVQASVLGWIERGADPQKLALGVPFYGRTFTLTDSSDTSVGAASIGTGAAGPYTATAGFLGYNEIVEKINEGGWTEAWDEEAGAAYAYNGATWLSYDNTKSLTAKAEYAKSLNLGGIMLWSIETDDFKGKSGTTFQLLQAINTALTSTSDSSSSDTDSANSDTDKASSDTDSASSSDTDSAGSDTDSASSDTDSSSSDSSSSTTFACTSTGWFRNSTDCSIFYQCVVSGDSYVLHTYSCPSGLVFDLTANACNYATLVSGC